jgi:hypothetical protein
VQAPPAVVVLRERQALARRRRAIGGEILAFGRVGLEGIRANDRPDLADRGLLGELAHLGIGPCGHLGDDGSHLIDRELAGAERTEGRRQLVTPSGESDELLGVAGRHARLPGDPLRRRVDAPSRPCVGLERLGDEPCQLCLQRVDVAAHLGELMLQDVERRPVGRGLIGSDRCCNRRHAPRIHEHTFDATPRPRNQISSMGSSVMTSSTIR